MQKLSTLYDLVAVCTTKMSSATETSKHFNIAHAFDSVERILAELPDLDAAAAQVLKAGFGALLHDPEFLRGAEATLEGCSLAFGEQLTQDIIAISNIDPASKA